MEFTTEITTSRNPLLQEIRKAVSQGRATGNGLIVAEGPHLLEDALRSSWTVETVLVTARARNKFARLIATLHGDLVELPERVFASIAATEHSQEIMALVRPRRWSWDQITSGNTMLVILDGLQDPGNAGTVIRSAEAFGATGAVFTHGSIRTANAKFLRATAGSIFRLPFVESESVTNILEEVEARSLALYSLTASGRTILSKAALCGPCAFAVGSEAHGVSGKLLKASTELRIPTRGVESLNAAVACSIALFAADQMRAAR